MRPTQLHRVPALGYIFLRIGAAAFGGLGASLALIERELVQTAVAHRRGGHRRPDLYQTAAGVHRSAGGRVSWLHPRRLVRLGGGHGGVPFSRCPHDAAVLAAAYVSVTAVPAMRPALTGPAAIVGVLLATTYRMGKANIPDRLTLGIALASIVAGAVLGISAAVIVVLAGLVGVGLYALPLWKQAA